MHIFCEQNKSLNIKIPNLLICNGQRINEEEVFDLIQQVYHGEIPPHFMPKDMAFRRRQESKYAFFMGAIVLVSAIVITLLMLAH